MLFRSVTGSYDEVRIGRGTCAGDASIAAIVTGRTRRATEVAYSQFDDAARIGQAADAELRVGHVQPATRWVNRKKFFVKKAAEGEAELIRHAIRADRSYDRLAAG